MGSSKVEQYIDENQLYWFKINRPDKRNAIDFDVMNELEHALTVVKEQSSVRAFVITGKGNQSFCSGGDLSIFHALYSKEEALGMLEKMGRILYSLMTLPVPTIAIINGTAIGGGCEIAAACDERWAFSSSKMGFVQGKLGITTGWGGASMLMEKLSHANALKMLISAKIYSASEAKELGFIQRIVLEDELDEWKKVINVASPVIRSYKKAFIRKWEQSNLKERMLAEIEQCAILWESEEHHEAVKMFLEAKKR
ncbi:putative enoyl-CoA hydratase echA8 [Bacillus sp. THAF10]|uniref:enoyl-CoA hydratase/isomerase family protein n=1 Tax=Bacillus sp. THAF10 TaxID=2587848 RepID=UPI0012687E86|nr:enoyl-CoA hydratase/isomerase family protein [Bacillus sp. THAF10]QFT88760.1 putative enoyl-CoA hydratase echA8 [Bacillus sp. THAF10]